jgi:hypothetical protein
MNYESHIISVSHRSRIKQNRKERILQKNRNSEFENYISNEKITNPEISMDGIQISSEMEKETNIEISSQCEEEDVGQTYLREEGEVPMEEIMEVETDDNESSNIIMSKTDELLFQFKIKSSVSETDLGLLLKILKDPAFNLNEVKEKFLNMIYVI